MECLAAAYGWPPGAIGDLPLDELETWAQLARMRLENPRHACPWLK